MKAAGEQSLLSLSFVAQIKNMFNANSSEIVENETPKQVRSKYGVNRKDSSEKLQSRNPPKSPVAPSYVAGQRYSFSTRDRCRSRELSRIYNEDGSSETSISSESDGSPQRHEEVKSDAKTGKTRKKKTRQDKGSPKDTISQKQLVFDEAFDVESGRLNTSYSTEESSDSLSNPNKENTFIVGLKSVGKGHTSWFARGRHLTIFSIVTALAGMALSIASRKSLAFVKLREPIMFSPFIENVTKVGLMRVEICFLDETNPNITGNPLPEGGDNVWEGYDFGDQDGRNRYLPVLSERVEAALEDDVLVGCGVIPLTTENVNDRLWNVARSFLFLAIVLGSFVTVFLCSACYWETINLKPVSIGLLLAYFFQSLSFFFFDSDLCREYQCGLAEGSILSVFASLMWFASGLASIRMDMVYHRRLREARKLRRRQERKQRKKMKSKLNRSPSAETTTTSSDEVTQDSPCRSSLSSLDSSDFDAKSSDAEDTFHKKVYSSDAHQWIA